MPKVLYLLNISNPDRLSADSGWVVADTLLPALVDAGASTVFAAPAPVTDARVGFEPTPVPGTKYRARFDGDTAALTGLLQRVRPDVVVANQVESAPLVRAAMLEAGNGAVLAGYCHYLPFSFARTELLLDPSLDDGGLGHPVLLTFLAGVAALDRVLVHSQTAARWLTDAAERAGLEIGERLRIVPPPRDPALVREDTPDPPQGGTATAVYNHRLYAHYGTQEFLRLAVELASPALRLTVMDLLGNRRPGRTALDDSPERFRNALAGLPGVEVVSDGGDRARYREVLAAAHFGIAPYRPSCPWSLSVVDCQGMGLPVISPRMGWMAEHIHPDLLFDTPAEAAKTTARLIGDPAFYAEHSAFAKASTEAMAPAVIAARYLEALA
ncbi:vegetative cell wall protein [Kitasatospora sp. NRRL B-11411]|uniref:vegetative cell wall protein n=1 Tax=Kitasatospora sp. NRRL B-11411 TaxID=1463822 RepID=UPI0004C3A0C4|nr:vegetative cell wall protein [Kitasatospora sp. NRRL B-11411]